MSLPKPIRQHRADFVGTKIQSADGLVHHMHPANLKLKLCGQPRNKTDRLVNDVVTCGYCKLTQLIAGWNYVYLKS
jgi:hypothetical protein